MRCMGVSNEALMASWYLMFVLIYFTFALVMQGLFLVSMYCMAPLENVKDSGYHLRELAGVPTFWLIALVCSTQYFAVSGVEYFGPAYFTQELGSTPAQASLLYLAGGGGAILGAVVGSYVADRFGGYRRRKTALLYCIVLATAANAPLGNNRV